MEGILRASTDHIGPEGGTVKFFIEPGAGCEGRDFVLLMGNHGTFPGMVHKKLVIPINWDFVTQYGLTLDDFKGTVGETVNIAISEDQAKVLKGDVFYFAYYIDGPDPITSNPVAVRIGG
jgi:hypothetical protein